MRVRQSLTPKSWSELDAAIREPVDDRLGRISLPFGTRSQSEDVLRIAVQLVATVGEIEDRGGGHRHGGVVDLDVDSFDGDRDALLEILDRGHGLVGVLELLEQVSQPRIVVIGIADLDRPLGDVEQRDGFRFGWHALSLPAA